MASDIIFDTSAILALLFGETGEERVKKEYKNALLSTVNAAEVYSVLNRSALSYEIFEELFGHKIVNFTPNQAKIAGLLSAQTKPYGLSLGDRACIAVALDLKMPVLTADRIWEKLNLPLKIHFIRP